MRRFRDQKGFSLLELLMAVSMLAFGLLATISMQGVAKNAGSLSNRLALNTALAQQAMEEILARKIDDPTLVASIAPGTVYDLNPDPAMTYLYVPGVGRFDATYQTNTNTPIFGTTRVIVNIDLTVGSLDASSTIARSDLLVPGQSRVTYTCYKRVL